MLLNFLKLNEYNIENTIDLLKTVEGLKYFDDVVDKLKGKEIVDW